MKITIADIKAAFERGKRFITHDAWLIGKPGEELPRGFFIKQIRVVILLFKGIVEETLLLRAAALTLATLLFIVPFLIFLFFFIQYFNLGEQAYGALWNTVSGKMSVVIDVVQGQDQKGDTDDAENDEAASESAINTDTTSSTSPTVVAAPLREEKNKNNQKLMQDIVAMLFPGLGDDELLGGDNNYTNPVSKLVELAAEGVATKKAFGITGILFILSTVFGFLRNVESSFNGIWGVTRKRNPFRAASDYLLVTLLLPFVAAVGIGMTALLASGKLGPLSLGVRGAQFFVVCLTFTLLYFIVPNTRVKIRNALLGGVVAGGLWTLSAWGIWQLQLGMARYELVFSGFALFPMFLLWIYVSWIILLFGALFSFAYQNESTFAMERLSDRAPYAYREAVAIRAMLEMAQRFAKGEAGFSVEEAAQQWNVPTRLLIDIMECLTDAHLATPCATEPVTYQPARAPEKTPVLAVLAAIREKGEDPSMFRQDDAYRELYQKLEQADTDWLQLDVQGLLVKLGTPGPEIPIKPE